MYYTDKNCVFSTLSLKYWENTEFNISSLKLPKCKLVGPFFISYVIIGLCFVFILSQITTIFVLLEEEKKYPHFLSIFFLKEAHILVYVQFGTNLFFDEIFEQKYFRFYFIQTEMMCPSQIAPLLNSQFHCLNCLSLW